MVCYCWVFKQRSKQGPDITFGYYVSYVSFTPDQLPPAPFFSQLLVLWNAQILDLAVFFLVVSFAYSSCPGTSS